MENNSGWIKLYRQFTNWRWYDSPIVKNLFIHCLLKANCKSKTWQNRIIPCGTFITSYSKLAQELGYTVQQIRTAIGKLKSTGEITHETTTNYSIITVKNWDGYQFINSCVNSQITTNKNIKNSSSSKENLNINFYGEYKNIGLSLEDYNKLLAITLSKKALDVLFKDFGEQVECGKENKFSFEFPHAHYIRIKRYWEARRKNPKRVTKFNSKNNDNWNSEDYYVN